MLDDRDRNARYNEAIRACIADFKEEQGRAPRVLDVGVGTGYLSQCCLLAGAEHVTGVDVNENMVAQAERNLAQVDRTGERFTVELVRRGKSPFEGKNLFDMIVSEILGTLAMSENMCKYLSLYAQHLQTFGEEKRVYMVPCETRQNFALRAWDRDELGEPLGTLLRSAVEHEARGRLVPSNAGGLGIDLSLYPSEQIHEPLQIHREKYDRLAPRSSSSTRR